MLDGDLAQRLGRLFRTALWDIRRIGCLSLFLCLASATAHAQVKFAAVIGPFFHAPSNSYYALYRLPGYRHEYNWEYVRRLARQQTYKDVRGRLAIVDNRDLHNFLVEKIKFPQETWIGLRYFCQSKKLLWIDWQEHERGSFAPWNPQWAGDPKITCLTHPDHTYMGAYYVGYGSFTWRVHGYRKAYPSYLVQYKMPD